MRMFRALDRVERRFFILYEFSARVVDSAEHIAHLDHPSAWSRRIMPQLGNFVRGGRTVAAAFGSGRGGFVAPILLGSDEVSAIAAIAAEIAPHDRVTSVRVLATDTGRAAIRTIESAPDRGSQR